MKRLFTIALCLYGFTVFSQPTDTLTYQRKDFMIPMRDGVKLNTVIYAPKTQGSWPILMMRSPYGVSDTSSPNRNEYVADMAREGYIFVAQDIRGRFKSEGAFEMQRFTRDKKNPKAVDESTDTYDAIEWILKNIPNNNGNVGIYGISYGGWTAMMGTIDPHPALKAASEQATPSDMWMGDDFHHNGAFRLSYGFEYAFMEEAAKEENSQFNFDQYDTYDWYLKLGTLANVNEKYFHGKIPTWNDFAKHPDYDEFWKKQAMSSRITTPTVPNLHVAGYWDQEDYYGPLKAYEVLEKKDTRNQNFLVIGPWNHGGWGRSKGDKLGNIKFEVPTGEQFRKEIQAKWFAYHLKGKNLPPPPEAVAFSVKGKPDGGFPEAMTFQTGSNTWKNYESWPPKEAKIQNLYFQAHGKLSFDAPKETDGFDSYVSDPAHPVPYRPRPIEATYSPGSRWFTWLTEDQRFVHNRPDVLTWQTDVLTDDLAVTGNLLAVLFASTSGTDSDWIVKLIDVYPEKYEQEPKMGGYQLMVANDVFRGRYRNSFEKPEAVKPDEVNKYAIDLHAMNHVFKKGHRIMVQVQSTWFPIIDRNPQKYVPNIFEAKESDFQSATQKIYRSGMNASCIQLPVMK